MFAPTCGLDPDTKTGNGAPILHPGSLTTCLQTLHLHLQCYLVLQRGRRLQYLLSALNCRRHWGRRPPATNPWSPTRNNLWQTRFKKFSHRYFIYCIHIYIYHIYIWTGILLLELFISTGISYLSMHIVEESIFFDAVYCWFLLLFCWLSTFGNDFASCMAINTFICNLCKTYFCNYGSLHQTRRNI